MDTQDGFFPLDLSWRDLNALALASVPVLNAEEIACQNDCHSLKWIVMPSHGFAGSKTETAHHCRSIVGIR
jgi:hypothetical protein